MQEQLVLKSDKDIEDFIKSTNRYWNGQEGIPTIKAIANGAPRPDVILVRNDNWSICSTFDNLASMRRLAPDEYWTKQITLIWAEQ